MNDKKNATNRFSRAIGNEIIATGAALMSLIMILAIITWFGGYTASIQAQIISDVVADGSVAFAKTDMEIYEVAFEKMADKLFNENKKVQNSNFVSLNSISKELTTIADAGSGGISGFFSDLEKNWLVHVRGIKKSGGLSTERFKYQRGRLIVKYADEATKKELSDMNDSGDSKTFTVAYDGPLFKDQLAKISITAQFKLPFIGRIYDRTASSTVFSRARDGVYYNSRTGADGFSANIRSFIDTLEKEAYAGVFDKDGNIFIDPNKYPKMGSFQQKAILNAARYVGDGYHQIGLHYRAWNFKDFPSKNLKKDCYAFVSCCYGLGPYLNNPTELRQTLGIKKHKAISRDVVYERNEPYSEEIWIRMHISETITMKGWINYKSEAKDEILEGKRSKPANTSFYKSISGKWNVRRGKSWKSDAWEAENSVVPEWYYDLNVISKYYGSPTVSGGHWEGNNYVVTVTLTTDKKLTYGGAVSLFTTKGSQLWSLSSCDTLEEKQLQPGDVCVFSNPNWEKHVDQDMTILWTLEEPDEGIFANLDSPDRDFTSHYAMYIGDSLFAESTVSKGKFSGGMVNSIRGLKPDPNNPTSLIFKIYRFDINGDSDDVGDENLSSYEGEEPEDETPTIQVEILKNANNS